MKEKVQIIMLEDDRDFCLAVRELLNVDNTFEMQKDYQSRASFLLDFEQENWQNIQLFWIDLNLTDGSALSLISMIKMKYPQSKCLVCTYQSDDTNLFNALRFGADGYILKDNSVNTYLQVLNEMMHSGAVMSPSIAKKIIYSFRKEVKEPLISLTKREQEVLEQLAKGLLYKEISTLLQISIETTKKHISNIYQKLHVQNRTEAVLKFLNK